MTAMINSPHHDADYRPSEQGHHADSPNGIEPELRGWRRRRLIQKITLFFFMFLGAGLVFLLLDV